MRRRLFRCKEPHHISFLIALVLYVVALLAHFNVIHVSAEIELWSWIVGYGLLLLAVTVKGL